jgi:hypothetical protein
MASVFQVVQTRLLHSRLWNLRITLDFKLSPFSEISKRAMRILVEVEIVNVEEAWQETVRIITISFKSRKKETKANSETLRNLKNSDALSWRSFSRCFAPLILPYPSVPTPQFTSPSFTQTICLGSPDTKNHKRVLTEELEFFTSVFKENE